MTKAPLIALGLLFSSASFATTFDAIEFRPSSEELVELGVITELHFGPVCGDATEIVVSIPTVHHGATFSGASLELKDGDEILLFTNVRHGESHELADNTPGSGVVFFCLHPSFYSSILIRLHYSKGQHTTNTVVFGIDATKWQ